MTLNDIQKDNACCELIPMQASAILMVTAWVALTVEISRRVLVFLDYGIRKDQSHGSKISTPSISNPMQEELNQQRLEHQTIFF
jgi:hypothetical protein